MTMLPSLLLTLVALAVVYATTRQHTTHAATIQALVTAAATERAEQRAEIQVLLQRIQAPEVAVVAHATETAAAPEGTYPLDDTEQAKAQDYQILAKEVLAKIHEAESEFSGVPLA